MTSGILVYTVLIIIIIKIWVLPDGATLVTQCHRGTVELRTGIMTSQGSAAALLVLSHIFRLWVTSAFQHKQKVYWECRQELGVFIGPTSCGHDRVLCQSPKVCTGTEWTYKSYVGRRWMNT